MNPIHTNHIEFNRSGDKPFFKQNPKMIAYWNTNPTKNALDAREYFENKKNFYTPSKSRLRWEFFIMRRKESWNRMLLCIFDLLVFKAKPMKGSPVLQRYYK